MTEISYHRIVVPVSSREEIDKLLKRRWRVGNGKGQVEITDEHVFLSERDDAEWLSKHLKVSYTTIPYAASSQPVRNTTTDDLCTIHWLPEQAIRETHKVIGGIEWTDDDRVYQVIIYTMRYHQEPFQAEQYDIGPLGFEIIGSNLRCCLIPGEITDIDLFEEDERDTLCNAVGREFEIRRMRHQEVADLLAQKTFYEQEAVDDYPGEK